VQIYKSVILATLALAACSPAENEAPSEPAAGAAPAEPSVIADTVYRNGRIYTVNEEQPWAEAVAIKDGRFLAVGAGADVEAFTGESTEVIDLGGSFAMPGIGDSHMHPALLMAKRAFCALPGTFAEPTEDDIVTKLKECIANYPEDREWFIAQGYTTPAMSKETLTREYLDKLIPDRPAWIEDESGHNAWFNTLAMEAAGVSKDFEDTPDEFFSRSADGDLAGVAFEGAMNPFLEVVLPQFDTALRKIAFTTLMDEALSKGITQFGDGYVFEGDLQAYQELHQEARIRQHLVLYLKGNLGTADLTPVAMLEQWWNDHDLPGIKGVKLGMGGAIESRSEALVDGYADSHKSPVESPLPGDQLSDEEAVAKDVVQPVIPAAEFADYIAQLDAAGFQVKVHAIGDGSVRATLDGFEKVIQANGNNRLRHHIDHCSLVHPDDFQRFVDNDISCTIWPPLNAPLGYNLGAIKPMLKPETWERMYANRGMHDSGIRLVNHTDAPAAVLWPWWGMEASITRGFPGKPEKGRMGPQHALTLEEVIIAYTINVAWSLHLEDVTGSIEEGKFADMIILNHNLFEIPPTDIHQTEVLKTLFKGQAVYPVQ
jgi:predicted amidohydrolase YtcJ